MTGKATNGRETSGGRDDRGRQIIRQWRMLRALESSRRGLTVEELHEVVEGECSVRTIYRDLEQLQAAGFSLTSDGGRWQLLRSGGTTSVDLPVRPSELIAISVARQLFEPLAESWLGISLAELEQRLHALLSPEGRRYCTEASRAAVALHPGPAALSERGELLETVERARRGRRCLRIRHRTPGKAWRDRVVEPLGIIYRAGAAYLVAHCREAGEVREFAFPRIESADLLEASFQPCADFDLDAYARRSFGVFQGPVHPIAIDLHPKVAHLAAERQWHPSQRVVSRGDGWVRVTMQAAGLPEVAAWVAGFGGYARAVAPAELVEAVERLHEEGLAHRNGQERDAPLNDAPAPR